MTSDSELPRILVTGGSGFIGSALVSSLVAQGLPVTVVDLLPCPVDGVAAITGDLSTPDVLEAALAERPSVIFHLAARTSVLQSVHDPQGVFHVNVATTQALLEGARRIGAEAFVFASTNAVVGESGGRLIDEHSVLRPLTPYGATKAAAEMLCSAYSASYGIAACSVRLTNVYGPGMDRKDTFVVRLLRAAARGDAVTIYGDGLQQRDYLYVADAVAGFEMAWRKRVIGPVIIGSGRSTSVVELCDLGREAVGGDIATTSVAAPVGEMRAVRVDLGHARSLGYSPQVRLQEGLRLTWESLRPSPVIGRPA